MEEPIWIQSRIVETIHKDSLHLHGGTDGVLNAGALESALLRPKNLWHYSNPKPDLAALAASLAHGVTKAHAFVDGNKRTGWILCRLMLKQNGIAVKASDEESIDAMLELAGGKWSEGDFAQWLRAHTRPVADS